MRRRLPDHRVRDVWAATDSPTGYSGLLSPRTVRGGSEVSIGQGEGGGNTFRPSERKGAEIQQKRERAPKRQNRHAIIAAPSELPSFSDGSERRLR